MLHHSRRCRRRGATLVEAAVVYPIVLLLTVGVIVVGLGVFRYQQVAALAREGARWASVHGSQYQKELNSKNEAGKPKAATQEDVRNYIVSKAAGLDKSTSALQVEVTWTTNNGRTHTDGNGKTIRNTVKVRIIYQWLPEGYFGKIPLSSTSVELMAF